MAHLGFGSRFIKFTPLTKIAPSFSLPALPTLFPSLLEGHFGYGEHKTLHRGEFGPCPVKTERSKPGPACTYSFLVLY